MTCRSAMLGQNRHGRSRPAACWPRSEHLATAMRPCRSQCWRFSPGKTMLQKSLYRQTLVLSFLLLSACDVAQNAQRDFNRVMHSSLSSSTAPTSRGYSTQAHATSRPPAAKPDSKPTEEAAKSESAPVAAPATPAPPSQDVNLMGKSEGQVRAMLGPPTSVEERAPGKTWHYRDGQCSVDVQMYPDVKTRQFGTLAYKVNSNDNSDEGRRECLARFRSRAQPGSG